MNRLIITLSALTVAAALSLHAAAAEPRPGYWEGQISLPTGPLKIGVMLEKSDAGWAASIDIPVQGLRGFNLSDVSFDDAGVAFAMKPLPGDPAFAGTLDEAGGAIHGTFSQSGASFDFDLARTGEGRKTVAGQTPAEGVPGEGLTGHWQGSLRPGPIELRLVVNVTGGGDAPLGATMDSLDQGVSDIPIDTIELDGRAVTFAVRPIRGTYRGTMSADGSQIDGAWTQAGQTLPLVLKRLAGRVTAERPQEPTPPFPYEVEEVTIDVEPGVRLAGTLTLPRGDGPFAAALMITGSGQQDRDESVMGHRPFWVIADHLTRHGIAVLRLDDRGAGGSTGDFSDATTDDFVNDGLAALRFLRADRRIDPARVGVIGHSEGGVTGPIVATRDDRVAFVVMLAGVGVPMSELLARQAQDVLRVMGADAETITQETGATSRVFEIVSEQGDTPEARDEVRRLIGKRMSELTDEQREALGASEAMVERQVRMMFSPWFRQLLAYDPAPTLRRVTCPVLAMNGSLDVQVAMEPNLKGIADALRSGGNDDVTIVPLPGLNHLFQRAETGAVSEYSAITETFNVEALNVLSDWIVARFVR